MIPFRPVMILTMGRTGSTLLESLLGCHPRIRTDGEPLALPIPTPLFRLQLKALRAFPRIYLCRVKIRQLETQPAVPAQAMKRLHSLGWRFIHLYREDLWRTVLSSRLAKHTGVWHQQVGEAERPTPRLHLNAEEIARGVRRAHQRLTQERELLREYPHLSLSYETDLEPESQWQTTADRVFEFLGLMSVQVSSNLRPTTPRHPEAFLSNWTEIQRLLTEPGFNQADALG